MSALWSNSREIISSRFFVIESCKAVSPSASYFKVERSSVSKKLFNFMNRPANWANHQGPKVFWPHPCDLCWPQCAMLFVGVCFSHWGQPQLLPILPQQQVRPRKPRDAAHNLHLYPFKKVYVQKFKLIWSLLSRLLQYPSEHRNEVIIWPHQHGHFATLLVVQCAQQTLRSPEIRVKLIDDFVADNDLHRGYYIRVRPLQTFFTFLRVSISCCFDQFLIQIPRDVGFK